MSGYFLTPFRVSLAVITDGVIPAGSYLVLSFDATSIRKGIRDSSFVVDKTLNDTGFNGIEDLDWENIYSIII